MSYRVLVNRFLVDIYWGMVLYLLSLSRNSKLQPFLYRLQHLNDETGIIFLQKHKATVVIFFYT